MQQLNSKNDFIHSLWLPNYVFYPLNYLSVMPLFVYVQFQNHLLLTDVLQFVYQIHITCFSLSFKNWYMHSGLNRSVFCNHTKVINTSPFDALQFQEEKVNIFFKTSLKNWSFFFRCNFDVHATLERCITFVEGNVGFGPKVEPD